MDILVTMDFRKSLMIISGKHRDLSQLIDKIKETSLLSGI